MERLNHELSLQAKILSSSTFIVFFSNFFLISPALGHVLYQGSTFTISNLCTFAVSKSPCSSTWVSEWVCEKVEFSEFFQQEEEEEEEEEEMRAKGPPPTPTNNTASPPPNPAAAGGGATSSRELEKLRKNLKEAQEQVFLLQEQVVLLQTEKKSVQKDLEEAHEEVAQLNTFVEQDAQHVIYPELNPILQTEKTSVQKDLNTFVEQDAQRVLNPKLNPRPWRGSRGSPSTTNLRN